MGASSNLTRRQLLGTAAATGALAAAGNGLWPGKAFAVTKPIELVHWSWLAASDGEVWAKMIQNFNDAHKDKGVQIRMEVIPEDQYPTKVLASAVTGQAPDFGWGTAGLRAKFAKEEVTVPLDDLAKQVGLDLSDFYEHVAQSGALSAVRQRPVHDPDGSHEPAARDQPRSRQGGRPRIAGPARGRAAGREGAARVGQGDDQARRRYRHALGHHDDRLGHASRP